MAYSLQGAQDKATLAYLGVGFAHGLQDAMTQQRAIAQQNWERQMEQNRLNLSERQFQAGQQQHAMEFQAQQENQAWLRQRQTEADRLAGLAEERQRMKDMFEGYRQTQQDALHRQQWEAEQNLKGKQLELEARREALQQIDAGLTNEEMNQAIRGMGLGWMSAPPRMPQDMQGPAQAPTVQTPWSMPAAMGQQEPDLERMMRQPGKETPEQRQVRRLAGMWVRKNVDRPAVAGFGDEPINLGGKPVSWDDLVRDPTKLGDIAYALNEKTGGGVPFATIVQGGTTTEIGGGTQSKLQRMGFKEPAEFVGYVGSVLRAAKENPEQFRAYLGSQYFPPGVRYDNMPRLEEKNDLPGDVRLGRQDTRTPETYTPSGDKEIGGHGQVNQAMAGALPVKGSASDSTPIALRNSLSPAQGYPPVNQAVPQPFGPQLPTTKEDDRNAVARVVASEQAQIYQAIQQGNPWGWIAAWKRGIARPEWIPPYVWKMTGETPPPHVGMMIEQRAQEESAAAQPQTRPASR